MLDNITKLAQNNLDTKHYGDDNTFFNYYLNTIEKGIDELDSKDIIVTRQSFDENDDGLVERANLSIEIKDSSHKVLNKIKSLIENQYESKPPMYDPVDFQDKIFDLYAESNKELLNQDNIKFHPSESTLQSGLDTNMFYMKLIFSVDVLVEDDEEEYLKGIKKADENFQ